MSRDKIGIIVLRFFWQASRADFSYFQMSLIFSAFALSPVPATATPLLGDVASAYNSPETLTDNPATAAFLPYSSIGYSAEQLKAESLTARYSGLKPAIIDHKGPSIPVDARPGSIIKLTTKFGAGAFFLPPIPFSFQAKTEKLPIILANSRIDVDAKIKAKILGAGSFIAGYRVSDNVGIGISGGFAKAHFNAEVFAQTTDPLAIIDGTAQLAFVNIAARAEMLHRRIGIGFGVNALKSTRATFKVSSPLSSGESPTSEFNSITQFKSGFIGARIDVAPRVTVFNELRYSRADPSETSISLVTLKKAPRDVHDTVAYRGGAILRLTSSFNWLSGFRYEPSPIGRGSRGQNAKIGYGTQEFLATVAGAGPLTPYYMISSGPQICLQQIRGRPVGAGSKSCSVMVEGGVSFTEASVGVDDTGETPGAYYYRKIGLIGGIRYDFSI